MGGLRPALLALLALALLAGPAAALEGPRCRDSGSDCVPDGTASSTKEFLFKVYGKQLNVVYDESEKVFSVRCDQGPEWQAGPVLAADDPMLPAFEAPTEVDHAAFEGCRLPNVSYAAALQALNVNVTKKLELLQLPVEAGARLTRRHLAGLNVGDFHLAADEYAGQPLRPAPDFLGNLTHLQSLYLYKVKAPRALLELPRGLKTLVLNDVALLAAERELQASPEPALRDSATRWLARLPELQTLSLVEQDTDDEDEAADAWLTPPPLAELPRLREATIRVPLAPLPKRWLDGSKLQTLNLVSCDISDLSNLPFEGANLTTLNISNNNLTDLPKDVFKSLRWLEELDVSRNNLSGRALKGAVQIPALRELKANDNPLGSLCGNSTIAVGKVPSELPRTLRRLELRKTGATRICYDWLKAPELMTIDLQNNAIESLEYDDLKMLRKANVAADGAVQLHLNSLRELAVTEDQLSECSTDAAAPPPTDPAEITRACVELSLSELHCDCSNARLRALLGACPRLLALAAGTGCSPATLRAGRHADFLDYKPDQLLCPYKDLCVPESECSCGAWRLSDNATVVQCAGALPAAPRWPRSSARRPLALLVAPRAGLAAVPRAALVQLSAPDNNVSELTEADIPDTLRELDLRNNSIARVSAAAAQRLRRVRAWLAGNPFACACADQPALALLRDANVTDWQYLSCGDDGPLRGRYLNGLQPEELCPSLLPLLAFSVVAVVVLLAAGVALWHWGKPHLKQFLFRRQLCLDWVLGADDTLEDPTKTEDVFVSYAHQDHAKATDIVSGLERRGYSTLLHGRDWMPGAAVSEHIARSVQSARRTLLLVSDDYGASKWALEEFRAAHAHALERRSARVLLVRCGLRAPERLPPDLQLHLRLNTYLDYKKDDDGFWDKLCRVMPRLPPEPAASGDPPTKDKKPSLAARFVSSSGRLTPPTTSRAAPSLSLRGAKLHKQPRLWTPPAPRAAPMADQPPRLSTPPPRAAQLEAADKLRRLLSPAEPVAVAAESPAAPGAC